MAEKKMTRKEALELMLDVTREGFETAEVQEARAILAHMIEQIDKQAARPKSKSSARVQNEPMAREFIHQLQALGEPVNAKWMTEHIKFCLTSQKAVAIAKIAIDWGAVEKVSIKNRTYYVAVDGWSPTE